MISLWNTCHFTVRGVLKYISNSFRFVEFEYRAFFTEFYPFIRFCNLISAGQIAWPTTGMCLECSRGDSDGSSSIGSSISDMNVQVAPAVAGSSVSDNHHAPLRDWSREAVLAFLHRWGYLLLLLLLVFLLHHHHHHIHLLVVIAFVYCPHHFYPLCAAEFFSHLFCTDHTGMIRGDGIQFQSPQRRHQKWAQG